MTKRSGSRSASAATLLCKLPALGDLVRLGLRWELPCLKSLSVVVFTSKFRTTLFRFRDASNIEQGCARCAAQEAHCGASAAEQPWRLAALLRDISECTDRKLPAGGCALCRSKMRSRRIAARSTMALACPLAGRYTREVHTELRETGGGAQLPAAEADTWPVQGRRVSAAEPRGRCFDINLWHASLVNASPDHTCLLGR